MNRTPFYNEHKKAGAKLIDFFGWEMPLQYTTISQEHNAARDNVGLFDISHMGGVFVWGPDALPYLQHLATNNVEKAALGEGIYAHLLTEKGGVLDDIFIFHLEEDKYFIVINASRRDVDVQWMNSQRGTFHITILEAPEGAGLALQGPKAVGLIEQLCPEAAGLGHHAIADFKFSETTCLISRTGYTGEDGFEFFGPAGHLFNVWKDLLRIGKNFDLALCGLGARDTLRTEVAYPLYGHELDEDHSPLEAGLNWVVKFDKGNFIGRDALLAQKSNGLTRRLYGVKVTGGGVARPGAKILKEGKIVGTIASGTFSPTLGYPIAMAYLPVEIDREGSDLKISQGTRELTAITVKLPFYSKPVIASK